MPPTAGVTPTPVVIPQEVPALMGRPNLNPGRVATELLYPVRLVDGITGPWRRAPGYGLVMYRLRYVHHSHGGVAEAPIVIVLKCEAVFMKLGLRNCRRIRKENAHSCHDRQNCPNGQEVESRHEDRPVLHGTPLD